MFISSHVLSIPKAFNTLSFVIIRHLLNEHFGADTINHGLFKTLKFIIQTFIVTGLFF